MMSHPLFPKLRQLKLSGMLNTLDVRVSQAMDQQLAPLEFLALLLDDELERRQPQPPGHESWLYPDATATKHWLILISRLPPGSTAP